MKKVIIGMSGGVDSAVSAILLLKQGYDVEGLFMRNWDSTINNEEGAPIDESGICTQEKDYNDAKSVCDKLGIKLHRHDFVKEYYDNVFEYFLSELKKGRTPNPDIMCNKYIKFDQFISVAQKLGADFIATGHYAKIENGLVYKAYDKNKDQTYFLSQVPIEKFKNVLFPLGDINKSEVRKIAEENDLIISHKKDSTGICFIGERNMKTFLANYLPNQPGDIINIETHEKLGTHIGLMYYTIGQRRGLDVGGTKKRLYAVGKDLNKNILWVAEGDDNKYLYSNSCVVSEVNSFINEKITKATAKFRYRQEDINVTIEWINDNKMIVKYAPYKAVTPGQACVIYKDDLMVYGGIIDEVYMDDKKITYL